VVVESQIGRIARRALHLLFVACCLVVTYILVVSFVFLLRIHSIRFEPGAVHAWYQAHDRTPYCKFAPGALFYTQGHAFRQYGRMHGIQVQLPWVQGSGIFDGQG
jgi:hypothetical protein